MRSWVFRVFAAAAFISLGGASVAIYDNVVTHHSEKRFQQKLRCSELASQYAKTKTDSSTFVLIEQADFSEPRNSCVASDSQYESGSIERLEVIDLLTNELLYMEICDTKVATLQSYCGNGRDIKLVKERDEAFKQSLLQRDSALTVGQSQQP